jgi:hypothetical protein
MIVPSSSSNHTLATLAPSEYPYLSRVTLLRVIASLALRVIVSKSDIPVATAFLFVEGVALTRRSPDLTTSSSSSLLLSLHAAGQLSAHNAHAV